MTLALSSHSLADNGVAQVGKHHYRAADDCQWRFRWVKRSMGFFQTVDAKTRIELYSQRRRWIQNSAWIYNSELDGLIIKRWEAHELHFVRFKLLESSLQPGLRVGCDHTATVDNLEHLQLLLQPTRGGRRSSVDKVDETWENGIHIPTSGTMLESEFGEIGTNERTVGARAVQGE